MPYDDLIGEFTRPDKRLYDLAERYERERNQIEAEAKEIGYTLEDVIKLTYDPKWIRGNKKGILEREAWLFQNLEALENIREGLAQASRGESVSLGSFEQYLDLDTD